MFATGLRGTLCCLTLAFGLAGCLDNDIPQVDQTPLSYLNMFHASPDAPSFDIYANEQKINVTAFDFGANLGYGTFKSGACPLAFKTAGTSTIALDSTYTLASDKTYTLFLVNNAVDMEGVLVTDVPGDAPTGTNAKIRFINLSPDAPDLIITKDDETAALLAPRSFKEVTEFQNVAQGRYTFYIRDADTEQSLTLISSTKIESGKYYTLIAKGFITPPSGNKNPLSLSIVIN